jgi:hypothetical protein
MFRININTLFELLFARGVLVSHHGGQSSIPGRDMYKVSRPQSTYFPRDETGLVCLPTQLERTLQLYW